METVNGYTINDKQKLQAEIESFRKKKNTCIIVGVIIAAISIIIMIVIASTVLAQANTMMANPGAYDSADVEELKKKAAVAKLVISFLGFGEGAGNIIAIAGGVSNGVKMKNRQNTLRRLETLEAENPETTKLIQACDKIFDLFLEPDDNYSSK